MQFHKDCGRWELIFRSVNWQKKEEEEKNKTKNFGKQSGIILKG